jgi:hypothetical protein
VNIFGPKTPLVFVVDAGPDENKFTDNLCRRGGFVCDRGRLRVDRSCKRGSSCGRVSGGFKGEGEDDGSTEKKRAGGTCEGSAVVGREEVTRDEM